MKSFRILCCMLLSLVVLTIQAQRIGCVHSGDGWGTRAEMYALPEPMDFDPQTTYRQPVVLISFKDRDFSMDDPKGYYDRLFNEKGFNGGYGLGCVADYFRDQSGGRLNLQFDIYGPVKVNKNAGGHGANYYGSEILMDALKQLCETETTDFSIYDWNHNGTVNQVLFVAAGFDGQQMAGYIFPNTGYLFSNLPGGIYLHFASVTSELWKDGSLYGLATIAHEFCHCLGLPDIYPMSPATMFSTVDEWDLMDGGNYTNKGWCPPNFSAMEKMYLKWDQPEELTEPTTITGMKPLSAGGKTYIIRNSGNPDEYYLLENRQQDGWDYGCPGNGLLIFHVDYTKAAWANSQVNTNDSHFRYDLFHADGKNYRDWDPANKGKDPDKYTMPDNMRSSYLSTSPYPFTDPVSLVVNQMLTNESSPASALFSKNAEGGLFMSKPITNIQMDADGTVSFDFMKEAVSVAPIRYSADGGDVPVAYFDYSGRCLPSVPSCPGIYIVRYADGTTRKVIR